MSEVEVFEVQCGECDSDFQIDSTQAGTVVRCPHCECSVEIPSLTEIMSEDGTVEGEFASKPPAATSKSAAGAVKTASQKKQPPQEKKKQERPTEQAASAPKNPPAKESRGIIKATTARSSAKLLLKMSGIFHYLACFVGIAWSVKVVGTLYPIVNAKRGGYIDWFIEAFITTAWAAALMGLLIAVAEIIKVIIHIQENMTTSDD